MTGDPGPLVRRRQLGAILRGYRREAGLSINQVAESLLCSPAKISRLETAQRNATLRDVRDLCNLYKISDHDVREQLMTLARGSRERGWWQDASLDPALATMIGMEASASSISDFQPLALPGLLQIREYAEAVFETWLPDNPDACQMAVDVRIRRQQILSSESRPAVHVILDEAALRRTIGGAAVMRKQLEHLASLAADSIIQLQIIPFNSGVHIGLIHGFTILEFRQAAPISAEQSLPAFTYLETLTGGTYLDQPSDVAPYISAFAQLSAQATSTGNSIKFIRSVAREL